MQGVTISSIEHELKVLDIDIDTMTKKLFKLGATRKGQYLFRRHVFNTIPYNADCWVRLRTDGKLTTLAVKQITSDNVDGTSEWEVVVDDFDTTLEILEKMGLKSKGYQENKRIMFEFNESEVCLDTWPKIPSYMEIEAAGADKVIDSLKKLGFTKEQATGMNTEKLYLKYGIDISKNADLTF